MLERLAGVVAPDASVLDIGCGTGLVTEQLLALVPRGRVLAVDASPEMVALAAARLGARASVWAEDVLDLELGEPVDAVVSTAALHWVSDHDRMWQRIAGALRAGGRLEVQCGGAGNIAGVRAAIDSAAAAHAPELRGFCPWTFATPAQTERRLRRAGFEGVRCWLEPRPTRPEDPATFVRTSILPAHLERLPEPQRERFARAVLERVCLPLDYVRLNVSAVRSGGPPVII